MVPVRHRPDTADEADAVTYITVGDRCVQILREAGTRWRAEGLPGSQALFGNAAGSREASHPHARTLCTATHEGYQLH